MVIDTKAFHSHDLHIYREKEDFLFLSAFLSVAYPYIDYISRKLNQLTQNRGNHGRLYPCTTFDKFDLFEQDHFNKKTRITTWIAAYDKM